MSAAAFEIDQAVEPLCVRLSGQWSLRDQENDFARLRQQLQPYFANARAHWNLQEIEQLDTAGAAVLWNGWQGKIDERMHLTAEQTKIFETLTALGPNKVRKTQLDPFAPLLFWGNIVLKMKSHTSDAIQLLGSLWIEIAYLFRHPAEFPWREFSANVYKSGVTALPVTGLLGFMIGVAMSYLMARQLHVFGADIFIVNILGLAIIRELGPILMAILIAGRSGSAMTAQIGVMRVTEEIDALTTMGVSRMLRIILPKVLGLTFVAPFLVLWTSAWALAGGALSAHTELDLSFHFFFDYLPRVVDPVNLTLSIIKGLLFGFVVSLVACHFGLRIRPDTESLSLSTTSSVVTAITAVILLDAWFAILTRGIGV